jgi:hypothetical protein
MVSPDDEIRRRPGVATRETPKGVILARLDDGACFSINHVGAAFWDLIETPRRFSEICAGLTDRFRVEAAAVERDLESLVSALERAALIDVTPRR